MFKSNNLILLSLIAVALTASAAWAADGWASMNGGTTGGAGGTTVTVSNETDLRAYATDTGDVPYIIQVQGTITLSARVDVFANKTIAGIGTNPTIVGELRIRGQDGSGNPLGYNVIIQDLTIRDSTTDDKDCITIQDSAHNIWIHHCNISNGADGGIDITHASDYITVSWCKFYYTRDNGHNFVNLVGHSDNNASEDSGHLLVTFHHNWWSDMCVERMPRVRFGQVHVYNNYYSSTLANYNIGVGNGSQIRVESCYFQDVADGCAWKDYSTGLAGHIGWNADNVFVNTTEPTWATNEYNTIFVPPYSYTLDDAVSVPGIVMAGAGAGGGGGDTTPPAAPMGLTATAGNATVGLDWNDNTEADLAGYNVYRATVQGGPYTAIATGVAVSAYTDNTVTNGTTYYYVVTAVDTSSNESANSNEASATPQGAPAQYMHVASVVTGSESAGGPNKRGTADVTIVDEYGSPVAGATVTGDFSGDFVETGNSAVTGADGVAHVVTGGTKKGGVTVSFCVSNVTHATLTYDEASNAPGTSCGGAPCTPTQVYVESVVTGTVGCGGANKNGQVTVTVYDDCGNPVAGALVDGTFTGDFSEVILNQVTDASGQAIFTSTGCVRKPSYTFCVDDVTASLPYNSAANVQTCGSY
jgi:pectate lyase